MTQSLLPNPSVSPQTLFLFHLFRVFFSLLPSCRSYSSSFLKQMQIEDWRFLIGNWVYELEIRRN
ncbi:hypothetical protein SOVF_096820 [Spinacia oleracea]|nr:hypothetical protein SOVF_096820 [Spinacia oleracea]